MGFGELIQLVGTAAYEQNGGALGDEGVGETPTDAAGGSDDEDFVVHGEDVFSWLRVKAEVLEIEGYKRSCVVISVDCIYIRKSLNFAKTPSAPLRCCVCHGN